MSTIVTYKDPETGKRRQKAARISVFAGPNDVVRELITMMRLHPNTYIYSIKQGAFSYAWKGPARDAFDSEQLKKYPYWNRSF